MSVSRRVGAGDRKLVENGSLREKSTLGTHRRTIREH